MNTQQICNQVLMIRPKNFAFNPETEISNAFQKKMEGPSKEKIQDLVVNEFDQMVDSLRNSGIQVMVIQDNDEKIRPDAVFPNNWISMHRDGTLITYPMQSVNRRSERREDIIVEIEKKFKVERRYSLEIFEDKEEYLEGTGSMIFDHDYKLIYACLSPRTNIISLQHLASLIGYRAIYFYAKDQKRKEIYHTNVMMALGVDFVVVCLDSVDADNREILRENFAISNKEIVEISFDQMNHFAGNMLQLQNMNGESILVMSKSAYNSLNESQIKCLKLKTKLLPVDIGTIETIGGGSARCMMAEVFLKPRK